MNMGRTQGGGLTNHSHTKHTNRTRRICFYPDINSAIGGWGSNRAQSGADTYAKLSGYVPNDFVSLEAAYIMGIAEGNGNIRWRLDIQAAGSGEDRATHGGDGTLKTATVVNDIVTLIDCTTEVNMGLGVGDFLGISINRIGTDGADTLAADWNVFCLVLDYIADM